jgi:predicted O-methyltransferase YrrM
MVAYSARKFAKKVVPSGVWRRLSAMRSAREFYNIYYKPQVDAIFRKLLETGERSNFTYDVTDRNLRYLVEMIACVTRTPPGEIAAYVQEARDDNDLRERAAEGASSSRLGGSPFGRRLGWYAAVRAMKPAVIVETGVERGHGALILCAALWRNAAEGKPGRYYGTDINPEAGRLLTGKYREIGKILYGDSIVSLEALNESIDLFINDSDHSADYEFREYQTVAAKLSPNALIFGDNAHVTDRLAVFSREKGRHFLFFREEPKDHWYPGGGIGISFSKD